MAHARVVGTILFSLLAVFCNAETKTYDFDIGWVMRNPDGMQERRVIGINGQWPIPIIRVTKGDRLIVNVKNSLDGQPTTLHFHGLFQNGTAEMDGVGIATQCGIPPGSSLKYDMMVDQPGTYWYHSHINGQYPDGVRGPLIVDDPDNPFADMIDEEYILTLSDWYHREMPGLIKGFISVTNPTGAEPVPQSALMNDKPSEKFVMEPGKTYFFRIINIGAFAAHHFWFEGHTMRIIEVDGVYHDPAEADMIYITAAQRYGVLVTAKDNTDANYAMVGSMDTDLFDTLPPNLNYNVTGWLEYDSAKEFPKAMEVSEWTDFDDILLVSHKKDETTRIFEDPTIRIEMTMKMGNLGNGANYAFINDQTYVNPVLPTLYTMLSTGEMANTKEVYSMYTNPFILAHNEVVEIVLNNADPGKHPFHLHGHNFQAIYRSPENAGYYASNSNYSMTNLPEYPMRRDVWMVNPNGHYVIRFRSDNPGVWLFHCHIEWHIDSGLIASMIEAPLVAQQVTTIPDDHYAICKEQGIPIAGNAAGNTQHLLDLTGERKPPAPLPAGFTAGGIVALVFSCIAAFIGMAVIGWYGVKPINNGDMVGQARVAKLTGQRTNA